MKDRVWPGRGAAYRSSPFWATVVVACAYLVAGRLGQLLAVPPSYATAVWPPSGIALAAVLMLGPRVWPGIFVGALLVNGWTPLVNAPSFSAALMATSVTASISVGVTLQALFGGYLIRRFVGFPNPLIHDRQILLFLGLGGPVSCLVASAWGILTLRISGNLIGLGSITLNWWTWWVGDVIGVIIFAPLALICFGRPRNVWRSRMSSVVLPLTGAIAMTVIGFGVTQLLEDRRSKNQFRRIAANSFQLLDTEVARHVDLIDSLQRYFANSQFINRGEFAAFNHDSQIRCPATRLIAWVPREANSPEAEVRRAEANGTTTNDDTTNDDTTNEVTSSSAGSDVAIIQIDPSSDPQAIRLQEPEADLTGEERFAVAYVHPEESPFLEVGDDFAAIPNWLELMQDCCDTGNQVASAPFLATGEHESQHVLVLAPVYDRGTDPETVGERRKRLRGFIVGAFEVATLVQRAAASQDARSLRLDIVDRTQSDSPRIVHAAPADRSPHKSSEVVPLLRDEFGFNGTLWFSSRAWVCDFSPSGYFYVGQTNRYRWLILFSGLAMTALLGAFLLILSGRTARIEASESLYLDLYENAPDMFISLDVDTQRLIECNRTFLETTGMKKERVIDKHLYELFDPDSHTEARRAFRAFLIAGHVSDIELQLLGRDHELVDISMKMSAVRNESGKSIVCRAALRDITARKRVEADLKAQEMELAHVARLSMMGEMAAGLAHEINQPLGAIAAYAEGATIRLRDGKPDTKSLSLVLDRIAADAHRAGQVIRRLRQFLRKRTPDKTTIQINDMVREVAQFVDSDLKRRDVRLGIELSDDLPPVKGDPIQIQQVLLNLVRNGCDAMLETETARRILLIRTHCADGGKIDVTVEDCGHGLATTMNDQLFEAFFSTKDEGLGMGLAISRSIIESHGGEIWATPNLEGGASFHFSLPAAAEVYV